MIGSKPETAKEKCRAILEMSPGIRGNAPSFQNRFDEIAENIPDGPDGDAWGKLLADMYSAYPIDKGDSIDMVRALEQGRVMVMCEASDQYDDCIYVVPNDLYAARFNHCEIGSVWHVNEEGQKHELTYPMPTELRKELMQPLSKSQRANLMDLHDLRINKGQLHVTFASMPDHVFSAKARYDSGMLRLIKYEWLTHNNKDFDPLQHSLPGTDERPQKIEFIGGNPAHCITIDPSWRGPDLRDDRSLCHFKDSDAFIPQSAINSKNFTMISHGEEMKAIAEVIGLPLLGRNCTGMQVDGDEGGFRNIFITESRHPYRNDAEFIAIMIEGQVNSWALANESLLRADSANSQKNENANHPSMSF